MKQCGLPRWTSARSGVTNIQRSYVINRSGPPRYVLWNETQKKQRSVVREIFLVGTMLVFWYFRRGLVVCTDCGVLGIKWRFHKKSGMCGLGGSLWRRLFSYLPGRSCSMIIKVDTIWWSMPLALWVVWNQTGLTSWVADGTISSNARCASLLKKNIYIYICVCVCFVCWIFFFYFTVRIFFNFSHFCA